LRVRVEVDGASFRVTSLAGEWGGKIRDLPKVSIAYDLSLPVYRNWNYALSPLIVALFNQPA